MRLIDADALIDDLQCYLNQEMVDGPYPDIWTDTGDGIALAMRRVTEHPTITLNDLREEIYLDAVKHGLWEGDYGTENRSRAACAKLIKNEVVELDKAWCDEKNYIEELADVIIMCLSVAGKLGIDIDAAVTRKMEINKKRPWKHGKE